MSEQQELSMVFRKPKMVLALLAVVTAGLGALGWKVDPDHFYRAWLFAWLFWLSVTLGSLSWVMVHHLVGGGWGRAIQRPAEVAAMNMPLMLILFIPVYFGLKRLYPWADPAKLASDLVLQHRSGYMNPHGFAIRTAIYFVFWILWAWVLCNQSRRFDIDQNPELGRRMRRFSASGLVLFVITMTFAGTDWIMSRDAHWYSTVFGFIMVVGQAFSALVFLVVVLTMLLSREPLKSFVTRGHYNDLGNLMLTLTILWSYMNFSQFLISWTGNIRDDVEWLYPRAHGVYGSIGALMIVFHFFVPFFLLLSKHLKRHPELLARLAGVILAVRLLEYYWLIAPDPHGREGGFWLYPVALVLIGSVWMILYLSRLARTPLLAVSEHEGPSAMMEEDADPETGPHGERHAHPA